MLATAAKAAIIALRICFPSKVPKRIRNNDKAEIPHAIGVLSPYGEELW
jgi:hypothetical protein